jgi:RiboL-PSP-HEPN
MNELLKNQFKVELNQIQKYLIYLDKIEVFITTAGEETLTNDAFRSLKKQHIAFERDKKFFEYKAVMISLYGVLEKYIEIWVKSYLDALALIIPYPLLNEAIQNNHFKQSITLISMLIEDRWAKYQHLKKVEVVKNLHDCIQSVNRYQLNTDAFVIASGNLKHKRIVAIFETIGINLNDFLIKNKALNDVIGISERHHVEKEVLYNKINDLVDRRNTIAHGGEIDDLLERNIVKDYIAFLEVYCMAIFEALQENYIQQEAMHHYQEIKIVHHVWKKSILGCQVELLIVAKDDFLIVKTGDGHFYKRKIIELQVDNQSHSVLNIVDKTDIAIRTEPPITQNCSFFLKRSAR